MPARRSKSLLAAVSLLVLLNPLAASESDPIPPNVQSAVDRGLEWLSARQANNGSWNAAQSPSAAVTSLAVMAFMARGHVPGQGPFGDHLNKGIDYVLSQQKESGVIVVTGTNQSMYDHGICTIMLCEAYGMVDEARQKKIHTAVSKAVRLILNAQAVPKDANDKGGWRYRPESTDSDISVSGWQLMALRGAANIGANVPKKAIDDGIAYINRRAVLGGGFSYTEAANPNLGRTGTGILSLELLGQHHSKHALDGGDYLLRNPISTLGKNGMDMYFYACYYCAQAANQLGGKYWRGINGPIRESLIQKQRSNGSWDVGTSYEQMAGDNYATAMAVLALTVDYRVLPIYQR